MDHNVSALRARLEAAVAMDAPMPPKRMTLARMAKMYRAHAAKRFNGRHGRHEIKTIRLAHRPLSVLYGRLHPDEFHPRHLLAIREHWIQSGIKRTTIQARIQRLRKMFRWAHGLRLITRDMPEIGPIPFGHVAEAQPVPPVPDAIVEATIPRVSPIVGIMLRLMMLTGMRPGEVCDLHSSEIDRGGEVWVFRPSLHKNRWRDPENRKPREVFIGPQAQAILGPLLKPGPLFLTRSGRRWTEAILYSAVRNACIKHHLPRWSPNQIRHAAGTRVREEFGLDAAQALLGHARIETTQVYALKRRHLASEVALKIG